VLSAVIGIVVVAALVGGVAWLIGKRRGGEKEADDIDSPPIEAKA
jgi:hypothetical protein